MFRAPVALAAAGPDDLGGGASPPRCVAVPVVAGADGPEVVGDSPVPFDAARAERRGFTGQRDQALAAPGTDGSEVVFVGLGPAASLDDEALRRAGAALARAAGRGAAAAFLLPDGAVPTSPADDGVPPAARARAAAAVAEGAALASYRFGAWRSKPADARLASLVLAGGDGVAEGVARADVVAGAVCFARDLVNEPPSALTPARLAARAAEALADPAVTVEVWDEERIDTERLGGVLAVARGSAEPPRLVRATYEPPDPVRVDGAVPHVVLVGKGITFDSGGLSLKTPGGMTTMKTDMSGAAAVLATVGACPALGVGVRVTALAPLTENMPGGRAQKPGDVLRTRDGQTIEVLNTDAEGRLVLADALVLAAELEPDAIVDLATLTGACVVALGQGIAGLFGNDDGLVARVRAASTRAGEPTWPLPLPDEYRHHIDSDVADMKNIGKEGQAGAIAAALLLARFVGDKPWAHLDIAGPARSDEDAGVRVKGGTGFGVRTLLELLAAYGPAR